MIYKDLKKKEKGIINLHSHFFKFQHFVNNFLILNLIQMHYLYLSSASIREFLLISGQKAWLTTEYKSRKQRRFFLRILCSCVISFLPVSKNTSKMLYYCTIFLYSTYYVSTYKVIYSDRCHWSKFSFYVSNCRLLNISDDW